ncbi:MAG: hypothetical protein QXS42_06950 [Zestosphaera sp.]
MNRVANFLTTLHYGFLAVLALCDLLIHALLYVAVCRFWSLAGLRLALLFSDLPNDLKRSIREEYSAYIARNLSLAEIFRLLSDFRSAPSRPLGGNTWQ